MGGHTRTHTHHSQPRAKHKSLPSPADRPTQKAPSASGVEPSLQRRGSRARSGFSASGRSPTDEAVRGQECDFTSDRTGFRPGLWFASSGSCVPRVLTPLSHPLSSCRSACRPAPLFRVSRVLSLPSALDPRAQEALPRCPCGGVTPAVQPQALPGGPFWR